ncbi:MAG: stage II sporulation protein M [Nitrososphaerales archaeon]|nr:stage II sporulation protein M [Nitrososphaerales archaeon]
MSDQPVSPAVTVEREEQTSLKKELMGRRRVILFGLAFAIELTIFFGAMVYPIDPTRQQALVQQANTLVESTSGQGSAGIFATILANNMRVALLEMVPVAGAALFALSIFTTGQVIQALAVSSNLPGPVFGLALFLFPFAIVELSAYAVAVASGSMLLVAWRRRMLGKEVRVFALEMTLVVLAIVVAAAMETVGLVDPFVSFALWLPTAVGMATLVFAVRSAWS